MKCLKILIILLLSLNTTLTTKTDNISYECMYQPLESSTIPLLIELRESGSFDSIDDFVDYLLPMVAISDELFSTNAAGQLAQFIEESGYGNSNLTIETNNVGCVKCHDYYFPKGTKFWNKNHRHHARDDGPNDCFRKYPNIAVGVLGQGEHLKLSPRFRKCLKLNDSKKYLFCLKQQGYATSNTYYLNTTNYLTKYNLEERYDNYRNKTIIDSIFIDNTVRHILSSP